ncbi:MAG: aminopeptidase P family protein, partial [Rhodospirillaceae bacterium]|nr:aminopeptidase P family protein [Rhodospirillaceae bacterium]
MTDAMTDATADDRGFDPGEFRRRTQALQEGMAEAGLDALWLTTEADIRYVTGFLTRFWESPTRPWFVVVPAAGDPIAVIPAIGEPLMARTWIADIRTWPSPRPDDDGVSLLIDALGACVPAGGAIGLPRGPETHLRMPLADFDKVAGALFTRRIIDATDIVHRVREVKSPAEVAKIRAACAVADRAFATVPDFAGTGCRLDAVFRDFQIACLRAGADWVAYLAGGAGPGGYADVISPAAGVPLAPGDVLMLDT